MTGMLLSAFAFAFGLLILAGLLPGFRIASFWSALKASIVCGFLSAVLGKLLLAVLSLIFFLPILLTGPIGRFVVQGSVNAILLAMTAKIVSGVTFDSKKSLWFAAAALTLAQMILR